MSASTVYRIAFGPRKGQKVLELKVATEDLPLSKSKVKSKLCASWNGFSLHAGVSCRKDERKKLEKICRYIARPPIAKERLSIDKRTGEVILKLKRAYPSGTTHLKFSQLEFLEKLAALVPRPRINLTRFHGCLAPNSTIRSQVVPQADVPEKKPELDKPCDQKSISWARLLKKVFDIEIETCPNCGGKVKVIAAIEDRLVICKILDHLNLPTSAPKIFPARAPPIDLSFESQESNEFGDDYSSILV